MGVKHFSSSKKGFTLVELVVVIAVITLLSAIVVPSFVYITNKNKMDDERKRVELLNSYIALASIDADFISPQNAGQARELVMRLAEEDRLRFSLVSQLVGKGYHYWWDVLSCEITLGTAKDLETFRSTARAYNAAANRPSVLPNIRKYETMRFLPEAFFYSAELPVIFLDAEGSVVSELINSFYKISDYDDYVALYAAISAFERNDGDPAIAEHLRFVFDKTVFVTDNGNFVKNMNDTAKSVIFAPGIETITNSVKDLNGRADILTEGKPLMELMYSINIPETVKSIYSNSLLFRLSETVNTIVFENRAFDEVVGSVDAAFTNAYFKTNDGIFALGENDKKTVDKVEGDGRHRVFEGLVFTNPVAGFELEAKDTTAFALDDEEALSGGVVLETDIFVGIDADKDVSSKRVIWSSDNEELAVVNEGIVTFVEPYRSGSAVIRATSVTDETIFREVEVRVSEISGFVFRQDGVTIGDILEKKYYVHATDDRNQFNVQAFVPDGFKTFADILHDESVEFASSDRNVATISKSGRITLRTQTGETTISAGLTAYPAISSSFTLVVSDAISDYLWFDFVNRNEFLYRVGNGNDLDLTRVFSIEEEAASIGIGNSNVSLRIYDGDGNDMLAAKSGFYAVASGTTCRFYGTGVAIIEFNVRAEQLALETRRLAVEVVNALNVSEFSALTTDTGKSKVLLSDVVATQYSAAVTGGARLFGNGFCIDGSGLLPTVNADAAVLTIMEKGYADNIVVKASAFSADDADKNNCAVRLVGSGSRISNSCVSGGRMAIFADADAIVENCTEKVEGYVPSGYNALLPEMIVLGTEGYSDGQYDFNVAYGGQIFFSLANLAFEKYGRRLEFVLVAVDGLETSGAAVELGQGMHTLTLIAQNDYFYTVTGERLAKTEDFTVTIDVNVWQDAYITIGEFEANHVYNWGKTNYHAAAYVIKNIKIEDYIPTVDGKFVYGTYWENYGSGTSYPEKLTMTGGGGFEGRCNLNKAHKKDGAYFLLMSTNYTYKVGSSAFDISVIYKYAGKNGRAVSVTRSYELTGFFGMAGNLAGCINYNNFVDVP